MLGFTVAIVLLVLGGVAALILGARPRVAQAAGQIGAICGSAVGLLVSLRVLTAGTVEGMSGAWPMPGGSFHLEIDALSAFFLLPVFGLSRGDRALRPQLSCRWRPRCATAGADRRRPGSI